MKSKKEYILLFVVILAVSAYLIFRDTDKIHYQLPNIPPVSKTEITRIEISKPDASISLFKRDNNWFISPEEYPAGDDSVSRMIDVISGLKVTELVAEAKNDPRYDLTEEKKIQVKAWAKDILKLEFEVGKTAPSQHHTFIKLDDDARVYLAAGNFRTKFDKSVDDLRDKTVLSFDKDGIQDIEIIKGDQITRLVKKEFPAERPEEGSKTPDESRKTTLGWENPEGEKADEKSIENMLTALSDLKCQGFLDGTQKDRLTAPIYTINLKGAQSHKLTLFDNKDEDDDEAEDKPYPAISSGSKSPFLLSESQVKRIRKDPEALLKKEAEK